ncbi:MAG: hypothetical protein KAH10_07150 [Flavobacteriales bacterium]|nr:hypothetical protein [Flavobacteriales bacterium]
MELNDQVKEAIENIKVKVDRLRVELNLGSKDARDEFEKQKKNLQSWIAENELDIESLKGLSDEQARELKIKFEELQVQLALGRAESEENLREQSKKINRSIHEIKVKIESDKQYENFKKETHEKLEEFHDTFFVLKNMFEYDIEDGKKMWEEKKEEISKEIDSLSVESEEFINMVSEKFEDFTEEISSAWGSFKKTFK